MRQISIPISPFVGTGNAHAQPARDFYFLISLRPYQGQFSDCELGVPYPSNPTHFETHAPTAWRSPSRRMGRMYADQLLVSKHQLYRSPTIMLGA